LRKRPAPGRKRHAFAPVKAPLGYRTKSTPFYTRGILKRHHAVHSAIRFLRCCGIENAQAGVHFYVFHKPGEGNGWNLIPHATNEVAEQAFIDAGLSIVAPRQEPAAMPYTPFVVEPPHADPPPTPTRDEVWIVQEALSAAYDRSGQRYYGNATDTTIAAKLGLPRAWITAERERAHGPEINETAETSAKWRLELAARVAKLSENALALAAEAEALKTLFTEGPKP
jgi:hypothetical protein